MTDTDHGRMAFHFIDENVEYPVTCLTQTSDDHYVFLVIAQFNVAGVSGLHHHDGRGDDQSYGYGKLKNNQQITQ